MHHCVSIKAIGILLLVGSVAGWPSGPPFERLHNLVARQDTTTVQPSGTLTESSPSSGTSAAASSGESAATTTGAPSATSGTKTTGKATKTSTSSVNTDIDPRLPPGGVEMVTPAPAAESQYFKIGDYVTFKWNYTSLSVTPSAIDVMASCEVNNQLYTIALNQTVEPTGAVTWDTNGYQRTASIKLLTETYKLVIYDAAESISASPKAGYLGTSDQFTFGMYVPQKYTPLNDFKCATCQNSALSDLERQALGFTLIMATITTLSFTWFVAGFGALF